MTKFNFVEDARALMFVRQFHSKRVVRFLKNQQFYGIENIMDLQRSKDILLELSEKT